MSTPLIDVHSHFLTQTYVDAARAAGIIHPDGMPTWPTWDVDDHLHFMAGNNIERTILSLSSPGVHFGSDVDACELAIEVNDFAAEVARLHPQQFGFFASLPLPAVSSAVDEAIRSIDVLGAEGVVMMSNASGMYLGNSALNSLYEALDRRAAAVLIHPTSPPNNAEAALGRPKPMIEFMFETTRTITDMIFEGIVQRYPRIRFLIPHCGATVPLLSDRIELFRSLLPSPGRELMPKSTTREQLGKFWFDIAGLPFPTHAPVLAEIVGENRILYGSDYCWTPSFGVETQIRSIESAPAPKHVHDWRTLTTENAHQFLGNNKL